MAKLGEVLLLGDVREPDQVAEEHERAARRPPGRSRPATASAAVTYTSTRQRPITSGLSGFALCQASYAVDDAGQSADPTAARPPPGAPPRAAATPRTPAASSPKPIAKTGPADAPRGIGRSGRSRASISAVERVVQVHAAHVEKREREREERQAPGPTSAPASATPASVLVHTVGRFDTRPRSRYGVRL